MAPADALVLRKYQPQTPYKADAWQRALQRTGLLTRFPSIPTGLREGFIVGYPTISRVQSPPNSTTVSLYTSEFNDVVNKEIAKGRYIGPLPFSDITNLIGPFQTSPLSMIPKPGRPGKFRLIQNFSFPIEISPRFASPSINHAIDTALFPCTWGKFSTIYLLISRLPPGSQAATRDVAEAYRTIPLHPSQWPAAVVRISDSQACIDTCVAFGASPSCGAYGLLADAGAEILRANGIGPLDKWVDDHIFFRIPCTHLHDYNTAHLKWNQEIENTGIHHTGSRIFFSGASHKDGTIEEFSENCSYPIKDLTTKSKRSQEDKRFSYNLSDIDEISAELGIPWEITKDQPFAKSTIYIGFVWDLEARTVALSSAKIDKYTRAIDDWLTRPRHNLKHVQELYGKLLHAASILQRGRAYLTGLESMLTTCGKRPFVPHQPDKGINEDLRWWADKISTGAVVRSISTPPLFLDPQAYSDASSGIGVGIVIGQRWRAWRLRSDWSTFRGARDIGWAEAIGFELLVHYLDANLVEPQHLVVYGDNTSVIESWRVGRHRNRAINEIFKHLHSLLEISDNVHSVTPRYIPSADNPADGPSRGLYGPTHLLLPPLPLPEHLREDLADAADPLSARELRELREGRYSSSATRTLERLRDQQEEVERARAEAKLQDELLFHVLQDA